MKFTDVKLVKQLSNIAQEVSHRKCKNALGQTFSIKTALIKATLLGWFNKKIKSQYLELDLAVKNKFERKNPIDWQKSKCVICKMLLKINPLGYDVQNTEMYYCDFIIINFQKIYTYTKRLNICPKFVLSKVTMKHIKILLKFA